MPVVVIVRVFEEFVVLIKRGKLTMVVTHQVPVLFLSLNGLLGASLDRVAEVLESVKWVLKLAGVPGGSHPGHHPIIFGDPLGDGLLMGAPSGGGAPQELNTDGEVVGEGKDPALRPFGKSGRRKRLNVLDESHRASYLPLQVATGKIDPVNPGSGGMGGRPLDLKVGMVGLVNFSKFKFIENVVPLLLLVLGKENPRVVTRGVVFVGNEVKIPSEDVVDIMSVGGKPLEGVKHLSPTTGGRDVNVGEGEGVPFLPHKRGKDDGVDLPLNRNRVVQIVVRPYRFVNYDSSPRLPPSKAVVEDEMIRKVVL